MVDSSKNSFSRIIKNFDPKDEKQTLELKKILVRTEKKIQLVHN